MASEAVNRKSFPFKSIFRARAMFQKRRGGPSVKDDASDCYFLAGGLHPSHQKPIPVAWVQVGKAYVSCHLMPVYGCPQLPDKFPVKLKARRQGKSCFNFKVSDETLFEELERLTVAGFAAFRKAGYLS
jgi:hypothetical protein